MNRNDWAHEFFNRLSVPAVHRKAAARAIVAQMQTEGGDALWNPLNCVMRMPGSVLYGNNPAGVQSYASFDSGMEASVRTITQNCCGFPLIVERYRTPGVGALRICRAIRKSNWGTGSLIYAVLADITLRGYYDNYAAHPIAGSG